MDSLDHQHQSDSLTDSERSTSPSSQDTPGSTSSLNNTSDTTSTIPMKRPRGRPRKKEIETAPVSPHPLKKVIKVSKKILYPSAKSAPEVSKLTRQRFALLEEAAKERRGMKELAIIHNVERDETNTVTVGRKRSSSSSSSLGPCSFAVSTTDPVSSSSASSPLPPSTAKITTSQSEITVIVVPRILKSDIRRQYARMFTNVMNSHDHELMQSFLRRYGSKDLRMDKFMAPGALCDNKEEVTIVNPTTPRKKNSCDVTLYGVEHISLYWFMMNIMTPDQIFSIDDIKIRTKPDSMACTVTCKYSVRGTFLLDVTRGNVMHDMMELLVMWFIPALLPRITHGKGFDKSPFSPTMNMLDLLAYATRKYGPEVLHKRPDLCVNGEFTVYIDEHRKIETLELQAYPNSPVAQLKS